MKILLVIDCPTDLINGVSQSVLNLEQGLRDLGEDVRILMPSPDGKARIAHNSCDEMEQKKTDLSDKSSSSLNGGKDELFANVKAYLTPSHSFSIAYPGFRYSLVLTKKIRKAILQWKPDVIHSNTEGVLYFKAVALAKKTGAKHIHSFHTNFLDFYYTYFPFGKRISQALMVAYGKLCFRKMDGVISPSLWGKQIMERFHFPAPHYILANGIHTELFCTDRSEARKKIRTHYGIKDEEMVLLFVGRAAKEKNIERLISDFCMLKNAVQESNECAQENLAQGANLCDSVRPALKLMIVGGGPSLVSLKKQAEKSEEKAQILFTNMVPTEEIADYYAAGDVFVTASESEVQPLTYVEAMASGLPVVCADAPYVEGLVVNGETGYVFNTSEEFCDATLKVAENKTHAREMGERARARVASEYSIAHFAASALQIYEDVIEKSNH